MRLDVRQVTIAALLVMLACMAAARFASPAAADGAGGQTVEQALRDGAETAGAVYAGDCSHTRSPQDLGKVCTKLVEERNGVRAYLVGQTFSEFRRWIFIEDGPDGWVVARTAPMDTRANPVSVPWPVLGPEP
jgi:hypothetical protein